MEACVKTFLQGKGYTVNDAAMRVISDCEDWYANREIAKFHKRVTVQGTTYSLNRMNFAKRCCSDDANLCEILEVTAGDEATAAFANTVLAANEFNTQYRKQLERTSAEGTAACYVRLDNATFLDNGKAAGGDIRLNYVDATGFIPLTVENDIVVEAGFTGSNLKHGKKETTLVLFVRDDAGIYTAETHVFNSQGDEVRERQQSVFLGNVKPFAVMRNAEVNNLDNMEGYGLPKLWNAIPILKALDLTYNVLFGDLDKAEKLLLINEMICKFDEKGNPVPPNEQMKKLFVLLGEKLPDQKELIQEYNPSIRVEEITKTFELALSLLSLMFGYGTKKYSFENGQITTATEYIGERQDQMQELNRQRQEAIRYVQDLCRAILWFANTFHGTAYDLGADILVDFDDSYVTDKESVMERKREDALSFDIPELTVWYLMDAYALTEDEALQLVVRNQEEQEREEQTGSGEEED